MSPSAALAARAASRVATLASSLGRRARRPLASLAVAGGALLGGAAVLGLGAGCKSGLGDRCQIEADCQDGLLCNQATNTCQQTTGGQIDATVPDAPPVDAAPADAAPADAAPVDAAPVDAAPVDAAPVDAT